MCSEFRNKLYILSSHCLNDDFFRLVSDIKKIYSYEFNEIEIESTQSVLTAKQFLLHFLGQKFQFYFSIPHDYLIKFTFCSS